MLPDEWMQGINNNNKMAKLPQQMTEQEKVDLWLQNSVHTEEVTAEIDDRILDNTVTNHGNLMCCRRVVRDQCKAVDIEPEIRQTTGVAMQAKTKKIAL